MLSLISLCPDRDESVEAVEFYESVEFLLSLSFLWASYSASSVGNSYLQTGHWLCWWSHSPMHSLLNMWPQGSIVAFSLRSSQQIVHLGYSRDPSFSFCLQSFSVISTSGKLLMACSEAGGFPDLPLSCMEALRICSSRLSLTLDLKFISKGFIKSKSPPPIIGFKPRPKSSKESWGLVGMFSISSITMLRPEMGSWIILRVILLLIVVKGAWSKKIRGISLLALFYCWGAWALLALTWGWVWGASCCLGDWFWDAEVISSQKFCWQSGQETSTISRVGLIFLNSLLHTWQKYFFCTSL